MSADVQRVAEADTDIVQQTMGCFRILFRYLDDLRAAGLYDSTTVVVTGDHGIQEPAGVRELTHPINPGLFVKPTGTGDAPLARSGAPVSIENLRATLIEQAGGDPAPYGQTYFQVPADSTAPRRYYWLRPPFGGDPSFASVFDIVGDASDWSSWHLVDRIPLPDRGM